MKLLPLVLVIGCAASDPGPADLPESMAVEAVTTCSAGQWCTETSPAAEGTLLHGVWAVSADDVFAVGDKGTILRRTGGAWIAMSSGVTQNLRGVWAASSSDVWASGVSGTLLHFDGATWSVVPVPATVLVTSTPPDFDAVWGSSSSDVWFAGTGTVLHWNGSAFSSRGFAGALLSVSGTGPTDVWVTGENANLHHFNGTWGPSISPVSGTSTFFAVLAISSTDIWVSDFVSRSQTAHGTGPTGKWTPQNTGGAIFNGMSALAPDDVWGAGGSGRVGHWDGAAWTTEQPFGSVALWSVTTTPGDAWIVGSNNLIAHRSLQ